MPLFNYDEEVNVGIGPSGSASQRTSQKYRLDLPVGAKLQKLGVENFGVGRSRKLDLD